MLINKEFLLVEVYLLFNLHKYVQVLKILFIIMYNYNIFVISYYEIVSL